MELANFAFMAIVSAFSFAGFQLLIEARPSSWRAGILFGLSAVCLLLALFTVLLLDEATRFASIRATGLSSTETGFRLINPLQSSALLFGLLKGAVAIFLVLGLLQGILAAMAFAAMTPTPDWKRSDGWRKALGWVAGALPVPTVIAIILSLYIDNRERLSSVELPGLVRLALSPAATGSSPQSTAINPSPDSASSTVTFVGYALESLGGELRRRDLDMTEVLSRFNVPTGLRIIPESLSETTHREQQLCEPLQKLKLYVDNFADYNLFTLEVAHPLRALQMQWELSILEIEELIKINNQERYPLYEFPRWIRIEQSRWSNISSDAFVILGNQASNMLDDLNNGSNLINKYPNAISAENCRRPPIMETHPANFHPEMPHPQGIGPNQLQISPRELQRLIEHHSPYLVIGIANLYAAIGSFNTAYSLLQRWLDLDKRLQQAMQPADVLSRWMTIRVRSEAARMYLNLSPSARLNERYRTLVKETLNDYDRLLRPILGCTPGQREITPPLALSGSDVLFRAMLNLQLAHVTQHTEYATARGLAGLASSEDLQQAKVVASLDFNCFTKAFQAPTSGSCNNAQITLDRYKLNSVVAWGRLALISSDAKQGQQRMRPEERRTTIAEVAARVGLAVNQLEDLVKRNEACHQPKVARSPDADGIADDLQAARRVLEQALALNI